ncbi:MAG: RidA family protein [Proteobacteria bacterium]|nr:RidA family protein [Pseudomonadota bacterium]
MDILQPKDWPRPKGYSNGVVARGRLIVLAGQVGWDADERIVSDDLAAQLRQIFLNIRTLLDEAGARPEHLVRLTWFIADAEDYRARLREIGEAYREVLGKVYPPMSVIAVKGFVEPGAKVEIEAMAVIPD